MASRKEMVQFIHGLQQQGFSVQTTKSGHWRITHPELPTPVFTSGTPSDHRTIKNCESKIRRLIRNKAA